MSKRFSFFFFHLFTLNSKFLTVFSCLTDKTQVTPRISLINVLALNYLLRSQIFHERRRTTLSRPSNFGLRTPLEIFSGRRQRYQGKQLSSGSYRRVSASFFSPTRSSIN